MVSNPTSITKKYLDIWFNGKSSFGKGFKLLGWPVNEDTSPLLVLAKDGTLQVDLKVEEQILYSKTVLHYVQDPNGYTLKPELKKFFSLRCILGTLQSVWSQSKLLINYQNTYNRAKKYIDSIPMEIPDNKEKIEKNIQEEALPYLIAVDYMGEFIFSALTNKLDNPQKMDILSRLQKRIIKKDWYTQAILSWAKLQDKEISANEFIPVYGFAAGNDYELTRPRYYEILKRQKPNVVLEKVDDIKISSLEDLYVGLQYLRSEGKLRSLIWISALRDVLPIK